jgi:hypothetical protein
MPLQAKRSGFMPHFGDLFGAECFAMPQEMFQMQLTKTLFIVFLRNINAIFKPYNFLILGL